MEYNTQRKKLILPVYGRNVQSMVDYTMTIPDRTQRLHCAEKIVEIMAGMYPKGNQRTDLVQMLWDHLAYMSNYQLDIDWPFEITKVTEEEKPAPMPYPMNRISLRHYGHLTESLIAEVKEMEDSPKRDALIGLLTNQMRKNLYYSNANRNAMNNKRISDDLYRLSEGKIDVDETLMKFSQPIPTGNTVAKSRRAKKSK